MPYNLFLDDDPKRIPDKLTWIELPKVEWVIVPNYNDFINTILEKGIPKIVSFDHDLGDSSYREFFRANREDGVIHYDNIKEKTGYHCAQWLANYCIDNKLPIPVYDVHSMNPIGAANICSVLESAKSVMTYDK